MCLPKVPEWVNPQGLRPGILWQMDVTHISSFGQQCYVHVSVDTYSGYIYTSAHTGEATKLVITHCLAAFTAVGKPQQLKTDNGPAYISAAFQWFHKIITL
jgi:transposase InsO family protein